MPVDILAEMHPDYTLIEPAGIGVLENNNHSEVLRNTNLRLLLRGDALPSGMANHRIPAFVGIRKNEIASVLIRKY